MSLLYTLTLLVAICLLAVPTSSLDNGLARTPPMGWLSWERYRCDIDCVNDPENCISENLYMAMADRMSADGYGDAGYQYVNIDDCWAEKLRDPVTQQLIPDKTRFPSGMRALADYVHNRGLKLGIYGDYGTFTCGGYPGSLGFAKIDANTFANWTVDSLKLDGCYASIDSYPMGYPEMSRALNATGRPILYACSWPAYWQSAGRFNETQWNLLQQFCNYWRNYNDINDDWDSIVDIIEWWGDNQGVIAPIAGPGHWNDPDMVLCGDFALSIYECRAQFSLWSLWSAPLYLSSDLRAMDPAARDILLNREVIAIDQDTAGKQGTRVSVSGCDSNKKNCAQQVWQKTLSNGDHAIVLYNRESYGMPQSMTARWADIGLPAGSRWTVRNLWTHRAEGVFADSFTANINTHDAVIYRLTPATQSVSITQQA